MENNENFVEQTENVVQPTEETVAEPGKTFTQEEMNAAVGKAKARERAKLEKQYKKKYGELEDVLRAGVGDKSVEEMTATFRQYYKQNGVEIPQKLTYSDADIEILAKAEANEVISGGYEDVVEEVERLSSIGVQNMTAREKAVFRTLAEHRQTTERRRELAQIGVTEEEYESKDFKDFASMFNPTISTKDVYDIYRKSKPQKEIRTMGSMKNTPATESTVKEFYTVEEARRFTKADYDKNPALLAAVENSMQRWKK